LKELDNCIILDAELLGLGVPEVTVWFLDVKLLGVLDRIYIFLTFQNR
jgi:hypothetical protein